MNASPVVHNRQPLHHVAVAIVILLVATSCHAFTSPSDRPTQSSRRVSQRTSSIYMNTQLDNGDDNNSSIQNDRRSVLSSLFTTTGAVGASILFPTLANAEAETMERGGVELTPFNSLAFNYRGGDSPTIDGTKLNEVSIPYSEFLEKLNSDQVTFVEFLSPNGDAAYATFKSAEGSSSGSEKPIRIGEGYPIEDPKGWSSPAFVIKAVAKKGVPYKFVLPGLSDSFKNM